MDNKSMRKTGRGGVVWGCHLIALNNAILGLGRGRLPLHLQLCGRQSVDLDVLRSHGGSYERADEIL